MTPQSLNTESLSDLLVRVEGAGGPDRELDALITCVLDVRPDWCVYSNALVPTKGGLVRPDNRVAGSFTAGLYTASLDAALELVERVLPGCEVQISIFSAQVSDAEVWVGEQDFRNTVEAKTPTLALLAAMLKALLADAREPQTDPGRLVPPHGSGP